MAHAVRLIAAGLGVSIAPACVSSLAMPNVVLVADPDITTILSLGRGRDDHC